MRKPSNMTATKSFRRQQKPSGRSMARMTAAAQRMPTTPPEKESNMMVGLDMA
jgi:hypothetical protein